MDKNDENLEERHWKIYSIIIDWVKFADAKAGLIITLHLAFAAFLIPVIFSSGNFSVIHNNSTLVVLFWITLIYWIWTLFFLLCAIRPNCMSGSKENSNIFYGDIAKIEDYSISLTQNKEQFLEKDLCTQISVISKIASKKFENINNALFLFAFFLGFLIITLLVFLYVS